MTCNQPGSLPTRPDMPTCSTGLKITAACTPSGRRVPGKTSRHEMGWTSMRALTSCALNAALVQALETRWQWQVHTVDSISAAAAGLSEDDRAAVRAILVETEPVTAELMDTLPNLEVIAVMRSEPVNVDLTAATERALPVIHTPGRNAE